MRRSITPRRCAGPAPRSIRPIRRCREGAAALSRFVKAPPELARRLAQIGVVDRADGPRLAALLKPGQRLVSREGDFWRWDGFAAAAHAPTGAARRLAERGRLQAIEGELSTARADVDAKQRRGRSRRSSPRRRGGGRDRRARALREAQHATDAAREEHAAAEREISRNAARISALQGGQTADRPPAATRRWRAHREAETALAGLAGGRRDSKRKLAAVNETIAARPRARWPRSGSRRRPSRRDAELANRRLQAIAAERTDWNERKDTAPPRRSRPSASASRKRSASAPNSTTRREKFASQRQALIGEIETATAARRTAADLLAEAETALAAADKAARAALEAVGEARAEAARAEERLRRRQAPPRRYRARDPRSARRRAGGRRRNRRTQG